MLICPKCMKQLLKKGNSLICVNNHCYDIAKEGYVNLLLSRTEAGDNDLLVKSRIEFLNKDFYFPLARRLWYLLCDLNVKKILDCGCGTGYYTNILYNKYICPNNCETTEDNDSTKIEVDSFIKNTVYSIVGLDISKVAIKHAAKYSEVDYIVASNSDMPFENKSFGLLLHIFSPMFEKEDFRVLKDEGYMINVTPGPNHLYELKEMIYPSTYKNKDTVIELEYFNLIDVINQTFIMYLNNEDALNLIAMTPYYYTTSKKDIDKISFTGYKKVTADFRISIYRRKTEDYNVVYVNDETDIYNNFNRK